MIKVLVILTLCFCLAGLVFKVSSIFRLGRLFEKKKMTLSSRIFQLNYSGAVFNILFQSRLFRAGKFRWLVHGLMVAGFGYLLMVHALDDWTWVLFEEYQPGIEPFRMLRNLAGLMVIAACLGFLLRRTQHSRINLERRRRGVRFKVKGTLTIMVILGLVSSGFLTEGLSIISETRFDQMVEDYSGLAGEDEQVHLKAYWAKYYQVAFLKNMKVLPGQDIGQARISLEQGYDLNETYCLECHTLPNTAFVSLPIARLATPFAPWATEFHLDRVMYFIHLGFGLALVGLLPFSRMFHLIAIPLASVKKRMTPKDLDVCMGFLDLAGLSACTQCGLCTKVCSVYPDYQVTENAQILPHVKIETFTRLARKKVVDVSVLARLRSGNDDCTRCGRCADICPSGIDLVRVWTCADYLMGCLGCTDHYTTAMNASFDLWTGGGTEPARKKDEMPDPASPLSALIGQADAFEHCVQCTLCTNACPVVSYDLSENDLGPHQVMNLLRLGKAFMASGSKMVWHCLTCYQCQEICPMSIRVTDILLELRCQGQERAQTITLERLRGESK